MSNTDRHTTGAAPGDDRLRKRNRMLLLSIFVLFFGSLLVAGLLRFSGWRPAGMKNKGELLQPPADLRAFAPELADGGSYPWNPAARTWRIALAPPAACGTECATSLREAQLVWELLGRDAARVDILWLCEELPCDLPGDGSRAGHLRALRPDSTLRTKLPGVDDVAYSGGRDLPMYVVDPNGFVILRYAAGSDPGDLRSDLAKLLKLK